MHRRHIPLLLVLAALVHAFELPGMFARATWPRGGADGLPLNESRVSGSSRLALSAEARHVLGIEVKFAPGTPCAR